jgi:hypothetical protein
MGDGLGLGVLGALARLLGVLVCRPGVLAGVLAGVLYGVLSTPSRRANHVLEALSRGSMKISLIAPSKNCSYFFGDSHPQNLPSRFFAGLPAETLAR